MGRAVRRAKEEEARAKIEEEKRLEREKKRKEEHEKNRPMIEAREKAERERKEAEAEAERKRKEAEAEAERKKKEAEEEAERQKAKQAAEQHATLNVLRVLQKMSTAKPENFEELKNELEQVLEKELPNSGKQEAVLKAEATRVLDYSRQHVEKLKEKKVEADELRAVFTKRNEEREAHTRKLLEELMASAETTGEESSSRASALPGDLQGISTA